MTQVPSYHAKDDPAVAAARARERMRALSHRAFAGERSRRMFPMFSLMALLLAGLLFYFDLTRMNGPESPPYAHHTTYGHRK